MAGERRYLGVGVEGTFGTLVAAQAFLDATVVDLNVPDTPMVFYPGVSGDRQLTTAVAGAYAPRGRVDVGVDPAKIGYLLQAFFGSYAVSGSSTFTHTFKVGGGVEVLPSVSLRSGMGITERRFEGMSGERLTFSSNAQNPFLMASTQLVGEKDTLASLDGSAKTFASSLYTFRELAVNIASTGESTRVQGFEVILENSIDVEGGIRANSRFPAELPLNAVDVSGTLNLSFGNTDEYTRFWGNSSSAQSTDGSPVELQLLFTKGSTTFEILVPQAKWTSIGNPMEGRNRINQTIGFTGLRGGSEDTALQVELVNTTSSYAAA